MFKFYVNISQILSDDELRARIFVTPTLTVQCVQNVNNRDFVEPPPVHVFKNAHNLENELRVR